MTSSHRHIDTVLIANRGEIAVRVIRACREAGKRAVAVYSDADVHALHVRLADHAVRIGPPPSRDSYLRIDAIIDAALQAGCQAIHPGYGFLSENPVFAESVASAGLIFVGPPASAIRAMGDKTSAKELMRAHGVPVLSGTNAAVQSEEEALLIARTIGFPVLIKAAAGGGGKGMRIVRSDDELLSAVSAAQNEARQAFGDERVYIEKYLEGPRHIEFQILADHFGNVVHLGERECSVQRRHQKVIEECPSSVLTPALRESMGRAAVAAGVACGYVGAGTIEFLLDHDSNYYFLEMNTRLQVEHPVTEMVTGLDLVKLQLSIAEGAPLPFRQDQVQLRGHAIEARLCAEDVRQNFLPSTGRIETLRPPHGFGIRLDAGVEEGDEISIHYDSMFGKLIAWAATRGEAITALDRALAEMRISGVETTIPFCRFVLGHEAFVSGQFNIGFIPTYFRTEYLPGADDEEQLAAALLAIHLRDRSAGSVARTSPSTLPWLQQHRSRMRS